MGAGRFPSIFKVALYKYYATWYYRRMTTNDGTTWAEVLSPEDTYQELLKLQNLGVINVVLPTDPMGEEWVLVVEVGGLVKMSQAEVSCFLAGVSALTHFLGRRGLM